MLGLEERKRKERREKGTFITLRSQIRCAGEMTQLVRGHVAHHRTPVHFLAPTSGFSQPLVTPDPEGSDTSAGTDTTHIHNL